MDGASSGVSFVEELLAELRFAGYRPDAWWRFFARSWQRSHATAQAHPQLVRDWAAAAAAVAGGALAALSLERFAGESPRAHRALPWLTIGLAAHSADVFVHLGMNAATRGGPVYERLGGGNVLTMARRAVAALVWGHYAAGEALSRPALAVALVAAGTTDVADGALARRARHSTQLGAYLDGSADLSFALAFALMLRRQRLIPGWFLAAIGVRWLIPLGAALLRYFARARPISLHSSRWGKAAGAAQFAALALALAPDVHGIARVRRLSQGLAAACLLAIPLAQWRSAQEREPRR
jgi:phosphatidylglycerophosphate synthase